MSTLTELGDFLETLGIGVQAPNPNASLFLGSMPDEPDRVLCLYEYPGGPPEYVQTSTTPVAERVQIQVVARDVKYEDAAYLAALAWSALAVLRNATLGATYYRSITPNHSPATMGRDSNDRPKVFFNATVDKEVSLASVS